MTHAKKIMTLGGYSVGSQFSEHVGTKGYLDK